jgi:hypothetical protein
VLIGTVGRLREKPFKEQTSAGEAVASVVSDSGGVLLMGIVNRCATASSERCVHTVRKSKRLIGSLQSNAKLNEVLSFPAVPI